MNNKLIISIMGFVVVLVVTATITWFIEKKSPAREFFVATTPVPEDHYYFTLPYQEQKHRQSYFNNTFIQMLHHTHNATNTTNCWVCGMIPAHQKKGGTPFIPLPFSHNGSCQAWYMLLFASGKRTEGGLLFLLNKVCYQDKDGYPQAKGTKWESEEYQPDNVSIPYVFTNIRDSDKKEQFVISVTKTKADLCIRSIGRIPVGISDCTLILTIEGVNNSSFTASHNTYFVCGNYGYYQLPVGRSCVCNDCNIFLHAVSVFSVVQCSAPCVLLLVCLPKKNITEMKAQHMLDKEIAEMMSINIQDEYLDYPRKTNVFS